jgi:hypothetical protein
MLAPTTPAPTTKTDARLITIAQSLYPSIAQSLYRSIALVPELTLASENHCNVVLVCSSDHISVAH